MDSYSNTEVLLFISGENITRVGHSTNPDPFVKVFLDGKQVFITEPIKNSSNPVWPESTTIHYAFDKVQRVKIELWHHDILTSHNFLGEVEFLLNTLLGSLDHKLRLPLNQKSMLGKEKSFVTIKLEQGNSNASGALVFQLSARDLESKDWGGFSRSDPFYTISRPLKGSNEVVLVAQSDYIKNNNNPTWARMTCNLDKLCRNDLNAKLIVDVYDQDKGEKRDLIGSCKVSVNELLSASKKKSKGFPLVHPPTEKKYQKSSYRSSGTLLCNFAKIKANVTLRLLNYLASGLEISTIFAIDFTASNGDPRHPKSLHFRNPGISDYERALNEYQQAIVGVGKILQEYASDKQFACYGFGGKIHGETSHCFPLNGSKHDPYCVGVEGILRAYDAAFNFTTLSGPTCFAPMIEEAKRLAREAKSLQQRQKYIVLVILTDGVLSDLAETTNSIVSGSNLPISIIILGVGHANFSEMEYLDADFGPLKDKSGKSAKRDIVQFVPMAECGKEGALLARETLAELPGQIVHYFEMNNIYPRSEASTLNAYGPKIQDLFANSIFKQLRYTAKKGKDVAGTISAA